MKLLLFLVFLLPSAYSQDTNLSDITRAIGNGNADALGQFFDNSVEISVLDEEDLYDKTQAIQIVSQFFKNNSPTSFSQVHKGASKGKDSQYCIGNLSTDNSTFRVYIYMKISGGGALIQELRFDKE